MQSVGLIITGCVIVVTGVCQDISVEIVKFAFYMQ